MYKMDKIFAVLEKLVNAVNEGNNIRDTVRELRFIANNIPRLITDFHLLATYRQVSNVAHIGNAKRGQCFNVSFSNSEHYDVAIGFAETGAQDSTSNWYFHSWLVDRVTREIIEPTPTARYHYYGFVIPPESLEYYRVKLFKHGYIYPDEETTSERKT